MEENQIDLLKGEYTPAVAQELLSTLIKNELQFQRLQNFTSLIRYEDYCSQASLNIERLSEAQKEINSLVTTAKKQKAGIAVEITINLSLVEEEVMEEEKELCPSL